VHKRPTAVAGLILLAGLLPAAMAQVLFDTPRTFQLTQSCPAHVSIRTQRGAETLSPGQPFTALEENRARNPTHVLLALNSGRKWVALNCGHYGSTPPVPLPAPATACLPFFDRENNPVRVRVGGPADITPPPPALDAFGQAVTAVCGPPGQVVTAGAFQALMRRHPAVLTRTRQFTAGRVFAGRPAHTGNDGYLADLAEAWFAVHAFEHIFCGEPQANGPIGGLHYAGRYLQLQQNGQACRMDNLRQNEVVPGVIYSMGVVMKTLDGHLSRSSIKGYGLTLSAEDLLKAATAAFAANPGASRQKSTACLLPVQDDGHAFQAVFVRRQTGIRTFYPDATPDARTPACSQPVRLPPLP